jgi:hypothetical protein
MKNLFIIYLLSVLLNNTTASDDVTDSKYKLIRSDNGIQLYYKWINITENHKVRVLKLQLIIDESISDIRNTVIDEKQLKEWLSSVKENSRIKLIDSNNWYSYIQFEAPWPLKNQDCILKYNINHENNRINICFKNVPDYINYIEGVKRMGHLKGKWVLTPINEKKTLVEYEMYSNQTPVFPRWIVDPIIQKAMWKSIDNFRQLVNESN